MMPKKKYKEIDYNYKFNKSSDKYLEYGFDKLENLLYQTDKNTIHLPRSIDFYHLDLSIKELFDNGILSTTIDGKKVPVFYMENERWGEFSKTWKMTDKDHNVPTPYITIRRIKKEKGTRMEKANVVQNKLFRYKEIPIMDDGQIINLLFKMPQPTNVDLTYEINLFTKYRVDVNEMDKLLLKKYASTQLYVNINGSYMATTLEDIDEVSTVQNIDDDKYIVGKYQIKLLGFIQDENDFKITKSSRKPNISYKL